MGKIITISNRKGGVGKTMTAVSLAAGLAKQGKRVLCVDADPQYSLTISLGVVEPEKLDITLATIMSSLVSENGGNLTDGIIRHAEGIDIMPSNNILAGLELALVQAIGRETILRHYLDAVKPQYDYIVVDTSPSLGLLTINALAASDFVIIPVTPKFLDAKGLELLLKTISQVKRQINPNLVIGGILLTRVDRRANFTKEIISLIENAYGGKIRILK
ncbi:sporulation initiation inhibitor protein Soj [Clostridia bacterium]|nr:sporulation initiation inhibitor protein Soj [Clostridia bacterium]